MKSGTDFQNMSEIEFFEMSPEEYSSTQESAEKILDQSSVRSGIKYTYKMPNNKVVTVQKHDVTKQDEPDAEIASIVDSYDHILKAKLQRLLFKSASEINVKFALIRSSPSSFCNLVADLFRKETSADCSLIVSGSVRADRVYPPNTTLTFGDVYDIYPLDHELCLIRVSGEDLLKALENGVSKYPALEGRFPHVSNISFEFNPELPAGERVNPTSVLVDGTPLESERVYKLAVTNYIADGKDGYESLKRGHHLIDSGSRKPVRDLIIEFFCKLDLNLLGIPQTEEYFHEFWVYKANEDFLSKRFIRGNISQKVTFHEEMELALKRAESTADPNEMKPKLLQRINTIPDDKGQTDHILTKVLSQFNVQSVLEDKSKLSLDCLLRLRKYQLVNSMEVNPEGAYMMVIDLREEARFQRTNWGSKLQ